MAIWLIFAGILKIDKQQIKHNIGRSFCESPLVHIQPDLNENDEDPNIQFESKEGYLHITLKESVNNTTVPSPNTSQVSGLSASANTAFFFNSSFY